MNKIKAISEYKRLSSKYNALVMKGKLAKTQAQVDAITKRIQPVYGELLAHVQMMKTKFPELIKQ